MGQSRDTNIREFIEHDTSPNSFRKQSRSKLIQRHGVMQIEFHLTIFHDQTALYNGDVGARVEKQMLCRASVIRQRGSRFAGGVRLKEVKIIYSGEYHKHRTREKE